MSRSPRPFLLPEPAQSKQMEADSYNNWNRSFVRVYDDAKRDSDVVLLTGDLIDYGRGHWGVQARDRLGDDRYYHADRNWFLFYYLLASRDAYKQPSYTILGNHDWRFNPYPPLIKGALPTPDTLINNYEQFTQEEQRDILRKAHGPGYDRQFSYDLKARFLQKVESKDGLGCTTIREWR